MTFKGGAAMHVALHPLRREGRFLRLCVHCPACSGAVLDHFSIACGTTCTCPDQSEQKFWQVQDSSAKLCCAHTGTP